MQVRINDYTMEYDDSGIGIPLLLIHGYPLNHQMWRPQITGLGEIARVVAPDLRGHGLSDPVQGKYDMELLAQDCRELLDDLGIRRPVVIGGLSMGGYVTLAFYRLFPTRVAGLILAATRASADSPEGKANRDKSAALALEQGTPAIVASMLPRMMSPITYLEKPELVVTIEEIMETTSVEGITGDLMGMKDRPDSTPLLANIDKPTLILHGTDDQLVPLSEAESMHTAIKDSRLQVIADAGHLLNLEQPEQFNLAVHDFLLSI